MKKTIIKSIVMMVVGLMFATPTYAMQILIEMQTGETFTLEVDDSYVYVAQIKGMIQTKKGISPDQQRLIYNGVFLEEGKMLGEYGITEDEEGVPPTPTIRLVLRCCGTGIDNIFHDVTHGTLDYYTTYTDGKLSDQLTSGSVAAGTTVYVKATSDFGFTVKDMSIKAVESYASGDAEAPSLRAPSLGTTVTLTKVSEGLYSFTMPANGNDVNITASLPAKAKNTDAISYIDFDGETQTADAGTVYILDGTEEVLGNHEYDPDTGQPYMTWYVCNTPATENDGKGLCYNSKLTTEGRVNLILADGCKMTVNASESNPGALHAYDALTILGQTNGTGALNVSSENANGIHASNLFIAGGHVTAHSTNGDGIHCGEIIIYDGVVSASSDTNDGIDAYQGNVRIFGGQVTATTNGSTEDRHAGIRLSGLDTYVALSWRKPTDFIQANSYDLLTSSSRIYIEDNLMMQYSDNTGIHKICGVICKDDNGTPYNQWDDFYSIAGKKLTPYGYGGYCGSLEAFNELMWEIPLNANATSATDLSTTMTVEGKGTMTCNNPDSAPWNNNTKYPYSSVNVKATGSLTLQDITVNTPVTLHFLGDIPSDCQERYVVTIWNGESESYEPVELTQSNGVYTFQVPACGYAYIDPAIAISFADGETWRTWCDHNTWKLPHGIEIYSIYSMSANGQITLIPVNDPENPNGPVIPAGTPLLLQKTGDDLVAVYDSDAASNSLVSSSEVPIGNTDMFATLWGNPTNTAITEGYFTESGLTAYNFYRGAFVRVENNQEVSAHHCLLTTSSAIAPQSLAISGLTGSSEAFGHITYTGTATNDGGSLKFYKSKKNAEQGENAITPNTAGPTDLTDIQVRNGENWESVGTGFFIMATPAVGHRLPQPAADGTVSFIKAEVVTTNNSVQHAPRRSAPTLEVGQTLPVKFYKYYSDEGGSDPATDYYGLYYVVMPADENLSVSITANFPEVAKNTDAIKYIDENGEEQYKAAGEVYVLNGTEARLGYGSYNDRTQETWYVCNTDLTYTNGLEFYGKVHLILADGKTMTYNGTEKFISGYGTLDIYSQGGTTEGAISAKTTAESSINVYGDVTINGGNVSAESTHETSIYRYGIRVDGTLTINGGIVSGKSKYDGISGTTITINGGTISGTGSDSGIYCTAIPTGILLITGGHVCGVGDKYGIAARGDINITGGQIEATGGTDEDCAGMDSEAGDIILGWTNPTDYIKASSYYIKNGKVVKTADGQRFVALNMADANDISASTIVSGTVGNVTTIADKTLKPLDGNYVSINSGNFAFNESTNTTTSPFTITTGEGENATTTHYYIYKKDDTATLSYTGSGFVKVTGLPEGYAAVENQPLQRQFTMAASDVALTATAVTAPTITDVTYDGAAHAPKINQGAPENYVIAYKQGENAVTEAKNVGNYTCTMTGLGQYIGTTSVDFAITKRSTSLAVEIVDPVTTVDGHPLIISGDDAHLKVTLSPVAGEGETNLPKINGIVTLSSNGKPYNVAIVNGEGHYYVTNLADNAYDITADFDGDANHAESTSATTTLEVCKILTETTSSLDKTEINVGESVTVTAKINEVGLQRPVIDDETHTKKTIMFETKQPLSIDAIVTVKCKTPWDNGEGTSADVNNYTTAIVNGQGIKTFSHLPAGPRTVNVVYAGDDRYIGSISTVENLQVNKTETTIGVGTNSPVIAK